MPYEAGFVIVEIDRSLRQRSAIQRGGAGMNCDW